MPMPTAMPVPVAPAAGSNVTPPSLFAGLNESDATQDGVWIRPGHYIMRLNMMKGGTSQKPGAGDYQCTELTVCKVLGVSEAIEAGTEAHVVGETVTDMKMRRHQSFLGNVNAQLAGMEGMGLPALKADLAKSGKVVAELAMEALGPSQPYAGRFFEILARHIPTQKMSQVMNPATGQVEMVAGKFTRINYARPVSALELSEAMTPEEQAVIFPEGMAQILADEAAVNQAMGVPAAAPAAAPVAAPVAQAAPAAFTVVAMAGVNYQLPEGWQTREDAPGQGWDGTGWQPLSPA